MVRVSLVGAAAGLLVLAACSDRPAGPTPGRPTFDGEAAMERVRQQVAFGPRIPGTEGHALQLEWMLSHLDSLTPDVAVDTFSHVTTEGDSLTLMNVLARFRPEATRRILLLTHWDTRPRSDQAKDSAQMLLPVPGANDGASGTAVLLELASMFAAAPPPMGIDLLFVDGEDYGPTPDDMFLGARRYAAQLRDREEDPARPIYGVLLDMVGDADPSFPVEGISAQRARVVVRKIGDAVERLGYRSTFPDRVGQAVGDDHIHLLDAGLPAADIIDFSYGPNHSYWHTPADTPERVSATTLFMVGEVVAELIYSGG